MREFKASLFQALAHPRRLQIFELLRGGELPVKAMLVQIGGGSANVSQHLATLRSRGLVVNRKEGNQVFYSVRDPLLFQVLDLMRRYAAAHTHDHIAILERYRSENSRSGKPPRGRRSAHR